MSATDENWEPNQEYLQLLVSMGISHNTAVEALFCTGNKSVDDAVNYVFNNQENDVPTTLLAMSNETGDQAEEDQADEEDGNARYYKMTFVVNLSLKMGIGKIAAQVAHACLGLYREMLEQNMDTVLNHWEFVGEKKIVLKGNDDVHLLELYEKAKASTIPCYLVRDAGHTQIPANSITVLSLFGLEEDVDQITGKLNLL